MKITFKGYTIRKSGKLFRITDADGALYGHRVPSIDAAKAMILSRGRVMTRKEHSLIHGSDATRQPTERQAESERRVAAGECEGII